MRDPVSTSVTPEERRRSFLRLCYETGYHDGFHTDMFDKERYADDEEARMRYRVGARVGRRERRRIRHEL